MNDGTHSYYHAVKRYDFYFTVVSSVFMAICATLFVSEDVPPVDFIRSSLKPFYAAIDKLHRPAEYVRNFAVFCLVYARSLVLNFGIFTVDFCYLHQLSSASSGCDNIQLCLLGLLGFIDPYLQTPSHITVQQTP